MSQAVNYLEREWNVQLWLPFLRWMMKTPILDFVNDYKKSNKIRMHMPGHKGKLILGHEDMDITEIDGADSLCFADGIIRESEKNASLLFGSDTYYSTEGSSLCIRAMLFLAMTANKRNGRPICLAARNVHKTFITAAALLDFDCKWVYSKNKRTYHTCKLEASDIEEALKEMDELPFAVYITSPDYLGYISDIEGIAKVCKAYGVPLLVDNAHGAYLKLLSPSQHPIDLGATMCCDSAHKTFPALTGAAYLHISNEALDYYHLHVKEAMGMFASTSPSYLILESLDFCNLYMENSRDKVIDFIGKIAYFKEQLYYRAMKFMGDEPMKITIDARWFGYIGNELSDYLLSNDIVCEFHDNDFVVLMPTLENGECELQALYHALDSLDFKGGTMGIHRFTQTKKEAVMSIREASFSIRKRVKIEDALGCILADTAVTCPPAVPIVVCGEEITKEDIELFKYYGVEECSIVSK